MKLVTLPEVTTIIMGQSPPSSTYNFLRNGLPFFQGKTDFGDIYPTIRVFCSEPNKIADPNDILISVRAPVGSTNLTKVKSCIGRGLAAIRAKEKINFKYLFYFLRFYELDIAKIGKGSTFDAVSRDDLENIKIPIPPQEEQKRIAKILTKADKIRRTRRYALELSDTYLQSVFLEMFGDPVTNPMGWEWVNFGTLIKTLTDYHANGSYEILRNHVKLLDTPNYALMVRTTDLENNQFSKNVKYISESAYNFLQKSKLFGGEIIVNKIGSAGQVYLMPYINKPASLAMNQFLIRVDHKISSNLYIYHFLTSKYGQQILENNIQGAVTKTITKDAIKGIKFLLPPLKLQEKFAKIVQKYERIRKQQQEAQRQADHLFQSLLHQFFSQ